MKFVMDDKGKSAEKAGFVALPDKDYKQQKNEIKDFIKKHDKKDDDKDSKDKEDK